MIFILVGIIIDIILLLINNLIPDSLFFQNAVQGEVLAGIIIAPVTLLTWINSISEKERQERRENTIEALEIIKHYDTLLYEVSEELSKNEKITVELGYKVEHIMDNFSSLTRSLDIEERKKLTIDYGHILSAVSSIDPPKKFEEAIEWSRGLKIAQNAIIEELKKVDKLYILKEKKIKYFSEYELSTDSTFIFKEKHFYNCIITGFFSNPTLGSRLKNCVFENCIFEYKNEVKKEEAILILNSFFKSNSILGFTKVEGIAYTFPEKQYNRDNKVFELREGNITTYIEGNKYYNFSIDTTYIDKNKNEKVKEEILKKLSEKAIIKNNEKNNLNVSISKNYLMEVNLDRNLENTKWVSWHSIDKRKLETVEYFIFINRSEKEQNVIVFNKDNFKNILEDRQISPSGKYDLYFFGIEKNAVNSN